MNNRVLSAKLVLTGSKVWKGGGGEVRVTVWRGGPVLAFPLLFQYNPVYRTSVISSYPEYCSLLHYRIPYQDVDEFRFLTERSRKTSIKFLVFPSPALNFGQISDPENTFPDQEASSFRTQISLGLLRDKRHPSRNKPVHLFFFNFGLGTSYRKSVLPESIQSRACSLIYHGQQPITVRVIFTTLNGHRTCSHYRGVQIQISDFGSGRFSKHNVKKERQRRRQRTRTRTQKEAQITQMVERKMCAVKEEA